MRRSILVIAAAVGMAWALPGVAGAQARPTQDSVVLTGGNAGFRLPSIGINATSAPSGENPSGQVSLDAAPFSFNCCFFLSGPVTCLAVSGNTATLNFADQVFGVTTVQAVDNQPDVVSALPIGRAPTDCSPLFPLPPLIARFVVGGALISGDLTVVDAPPFPTSKDQCKNGGWQPFGFKNQGECVAFVERGSKP